MARLEELTKGALARGVLSDRAVKVVAVEWHGSSVVTLTFTDETTGKPGQELLYRDDEPRLTVDVAGRAWSMDADPGAGKTIMAGLFAKELMIRGDVERCLIVAPGSLVDQWQDELWQKFALEFKILTRETIEASRSGNPFSENPLLIARLDHLSRNEDLQAKLETSDWDLVIVDEAHKMSAHYAGGEVRETKRYKLGRLLGSVTRHLLLMTATPHAGIDEDHFDLDDLARRGARVEGRQGAATRSSRAVRHMGFQPGIPGSPSGKSPSGSSAPSSQAARTTPRHCCARTVASERPHASWPTGCT